jgi:hypothetical protein
VVAIARILERQFDLLEADVARATSRSRPARVSPARLCFRV